MVFVNKHALAGDYVVHRSHFPSEEHRQGLALHENFGLSHQLHRLTAHLRFPTEIIVAISVN